MLTQNVNFLVGNGQVGQASATGNFSALKVSGTVVQAVTGLGDSAEEYDTPSGSESGCVLTVTKGLVTMTIQMLPSTPGCEQDARRLATIALGNI